MCSSGDEDSDRAENSEESQALLQEKSDSSDEEQGQQAKHGDTSDDHGDQGKTWKQQLQPTLLMFFTLFLVCSPFHPYTDHDTWPAHVCQSA